MKVHKACKKVSACNAHKKNEGTQKNQDTQGT